MRKTKFLTNHFRRGNSSDIEQLSILKKIIKRTNRSSKSFGTDEFRKKTKIKKEK